MLVEEKVTISYGKAWRAREKTNKEIHGSEIDAYKSLDHYCHTILEKNPSSSAYLQTDKNRIF